MLARLLDSARGRSIPTTSGTASLPLLHRHTRRPPLTPKPGQPLAAISGIRGFDCLFEFDVDMWEGATRSLEHSSQSALLVRSPSFNLANGIIHLAPPNMPETEEFHMIRCL
jgi:hypothetical protein